MYRLSTIFGYISSVLLLLLILILVILQNVFRNQRLFDPVIKGLCRQIPRNFGIKVQVEGNLNLDPSRGYVFFSNHVNIFDPILLYGYIPLFLRGIEREEHFSLPLWGTIVRQIGNIPISQRDTKSALNSLEKAGKIIKAGTSIIIFPEGHRTRDGKLQTFKRGPFHLARNAHTDMVPVVLKGLWEVKTIHSLFVKPGSVKIIFAEPVPAQSIQDTSDRDLRVKTRGLIQEILDQNSDA
jgi:1-acyl-sn-glycerol-3-phosphate acyltransferase